MSREAAPPSPPGSWRIERLVPGGEGLSRCGDGRVGFASRVVPGDVIFPERLEEHKSYVRAVRWALVEAGPARRQPPCPIEERCGGCDWMQLDYSEQLVQKEQLVRDALERVGRLSNIPERVEIVQSPKRLGYRARARFHVSDQGALGFFRPGTHDVVPVGSCLVCDERINRALEDLRRRPAPPGARTVELRVVSGDPVARVRWSSGDPSRRARAGEAAESPESPDVFTQINADVNQLLVDRLVAGARARAARRFCDLYAGAGNFALPLARAGLTGLAVESSRNAVLQGERIARREGLEESLRFFAADAQTEVARLVRRRERFDLVVLDPPRAGARRTVREVAKLAPRFVAFCSCDPPTLARDLRELTKAGYRLVSVTGFDMFPQTHHVEVLAWLEHSLQD